MCSAHHSPVGATLERAIETALREYCEAEVLRTLQAAVAEPTLGLYADCDDPGGWMWRSTDLATPKTSLVCKFLCLSNLPPTILDWLPLSLVSKAGAQLHISPRKLPSCKLTKRYP